MTEQWFDDHVIDEAGRRWALQCPWDIGCVDGDIPTFLILTEEQRKAAWDGVSLTDSYRGGKAEEWQLRERSRRAQMRAEKKEKSAKSLAKLKAKHPGERYDQKLKQWVKYETEADAGVEGDAEVLGQTPEGDAPLS